MKDGQITVEQVSKLTFPRMMFCWNKNKDYGEHEMVVGIFPNRLNNEKVIGVLREWENAEDVPEPAELTMQKIADKFSIPVDQLKIKK